MPTATNELERAYQAGVRLAVLGDPVAHSLSPAMQSAGLEALHLPYRYDRFHVPAEDLRDAFLALKDLGFFGWNLTLPHKVAALELVDQIDPTASRLGAINTIVNRAGRLFGYNTDGPGLVAALNEAFQKPLENLTIAVLGAGGGAGQAAARYLAAIRNGRLLLATRTRSKIEPLYQELSRDRDVGVFDWTDLAELFSQAQVIINASSLGLSGEGPDWPVEWVRPDHLVFDMVYAPGETPLVRWARKRGAQAFDGLLMLLYQGVFGFELWFGKPAPIDAMRIALAQAARRTTL